MAPDRTARPPPADRGAPAKHSLSPPDGTDRSALHTGRWRPETPIPRSSAPSENLRPIAGCDTREQAALFHRQSRHFLALCQRWSEGLVDHYVSPSLQTGARQLAVRIVRRRYHAQANLFVRQQLLQRSRHPHIRIHLSCPRTVPLQNTTQLHSLDATDHWRMKRLPGQSKSNQSHSHHCDPPVSPPRRLPLPHRRFKTLRRSQPASAHCAPQSRPRVGRVPDASPTANVTRGCNARRSCDNWTPMPASSPSSTRQSPPAQNPALSDGRNAANSGAESSCHPSNKPSCCAPDACYVSSARMVLGPRKNGGTIPQVLESGKTSSGNSMPSTSPMNERLFWHRS